MAEAAEAVLEHRFAGEIIHWRGPSPFFFVAVPAETALELGRIARGVTYGWGMIPVEARIGAVVFTTALFPKNGTYLLPLKAAVRRQANATAGDKVEVQMTVQPARG